jgi:hypothetical protein
MDKKDTKIESVMEVVELSAYTTPKVIVDTKNEWAAYGADNNYFEDLIAYYKGSTTSSSIINGLAGLIYGGGLDATDSNKKPEEWAKLNSIIRAKDLKRIIFDRKLLGMAAMQVIYKDGKVKSIKHFPMNTLRAEKANDDGEIQGYYWSNDWSSIKKGDEPDRMPAYGFGDKIKSEIYILKPYVTGEFYYTQPDYAGALPYCELENQIGDYLINDVKNGFSGSLMINFNNGIPDKQTQRMTNNKVVKKFTGATGDKLLFNYNKSAESATTIERLALDNAPDHYQYLSDECRDKIIVGHRITSPLLLGIREAGSGFGSNADEIATSALLLDKVVVLGFQEELIDALDEIVAENGIALDLYFKTRIPRDFRDEDTIEAEQKEKVEDETKAELEEQIDTLLENTPNNTKEI